MKGFLSFQGFSGDIAGKMMVEMVAWRYRWKRMRVIERSVLKRKEKKWKQMRDKRWPSKESRDICEMSGRG